MELTLYQNSILNNSYSNVFYCKEWTDFSSETYVPLERYLNSLTHETYEIDNVYMTNKGEINLPLDAIYSNLWKYNYLKFSNGSTNFYAFIDRYEERNEVAIIYYSLDFWHTFSSLMHFRKSYLTRSKMLAFGNVQLLPYNLPVEYDSNLVPIYDSFVKTPSQSNTYNIVLEIQKYTTTQAGEESNREVYYALIRETYSIYNSGTSSFDTTLTYGFTMSKVIEILNILTRKQGGLNLKAHYIFGPDDFQDVNCYFEIGNIYVLPVEYNVENAINTSTLLTSYDRIDYHTTSISENYSITYDFCKFKDTNKSVMNILELWTIQNDFTNISIGNLTNLQEINNNGYDRIVYLKMFVNEYNFQLLLSFDNKIIDITNDYLVEVPFSSIRGEENTQLKMQRIFSSMNNVLSIGMKSIGIGADFGTSSSVGLLSSVKTIRRKKFNYARKNDKVGGLTYRRKTSEKSWSETTKTAGILDEMNEMPTSDVSQLIQANLPLYSSTQGTFDISNGLINAYYGLMLFKINPQNQQFVNNMIYETGYQVYYFGKDEILDSPSENTESNIIKFDSANIYGSFSQEVMQILKDILEDGIKIYYRNPTD